MNVKIYAGYGDMKKKQQKEMLERAKSGKKNTPKVPLKSRYIAVQRK